MTFSLLHGLLPLLAALASPGIPATTGTETGFRDPPTPATSDAETAKKTAPSRPLADAPAGERGAIGVLLRSAAWPRRVVALLRLQRFDCPDSAAMLVEARLDEHPAVRSFAWLVMGHRRIPPDTDWLDRETEPTVIRTALRSGYAIDEARLSRGIGALAKSSDLSDKMLAAELGMLSDDEELQELAADLVRTVVLRMSDEESGALGPRLTRLTGGPELRRAFRWRNWWKRNRRTSLEPGRIVPPLSDPVDPDRSSPTPSHPADLSEVATMPLEAFVELADHLEELARQPVDLAIVIDCTASMSAEIADAQGGVDDLMRFVGDVAGGIRVGVVGYRDRREKFETVGWDFTGSIKDARTNLWRLSAEGGGDRPELVDEGLELAVTKFAWNRHHRGVLILVGDAPPHPGTGARCVQLTEFAHRHGVTTHVIGCDPSIQDDDDPDAEIETVEIEEDREGPAGLRGMGRRTRHRERSSIGFFPEIAAAGGGRVVNLARDERLVPEIAGLVVGTDFELPMIEFFEVYMALCR